MANIQWISSVPVAASISALGLIGNLLSFLVWRRIVRRNLKGTASTGIYFTSLAIVDSGFLVFFLLVDTLQTARPSLSHAYWYAAFYCYIGFPMFFFFIVFSIWLVMAITFSRFMMVTFPTRVGQWYSNRNTALTIFAVGLLSFLVNFPHFFSFKPMKDPLDGSYFISGTKFQRESAKTYDFWFHCMFLVLVPWFSIAILNGLIIFILMTQAKAFDQMKGSEKISSERHERQMTVTLLVVTFTFLLLLAWQCVAQCFWMLGFGKGHSPSTWNMVQDSFAFAKLGLVINSSINCLLYCFSGTAFRRELQSLVRSRRTSVYSSSSTNARRLRSSTGVSNS